jgi:hypothetical protein
MLAARGGHLLWRFPLLSERSSQQALSQKA